MSTTNVEQLIADTPVHCLLRLQYDMLNVMYLLEQEFDLSDHNQQRETQNMLKSFEDICTSRSKTALKLQFKKNYPSKDHEHESYSMISHVINNLESKVSIEETTHVIYQELNGMAWDVLRAHYCNFVHYLDDEDIFMRYDRWFIERLEWLNEQPQTNLWNSGRTSSAVSPSPHIPYPSLQSLIQHQQSHPSTQRTLYFAIIKSSDKRNHWLCHIPTLDITALARGPEHILKITENPNWINEYEGLSIWFELLAWKTTYVRVLDPEEIALFEMVKEGPTPFNNLKISIT